MEEKSTILVLYAGHDPGGLCRRLYLTVEGMLAQGHRVHLVSAGEMFPRQHSNLEQHRVNLPFRKQKGFFFWLFFSFCAPFILFFHSIRARIDQVVLFHPAYTFFALPVRLVRRSSVSLFLRAVPLREDPSYSNSISGRVKHFFARNGLFLATQIIVSTAFQKEQLKTVSKGCSSKAVVLPTPVIYPKSLKSIEHSESIPELNISDGGLVASELQPAPLIDKDKWKLWFSRASQRKKKLCEQFGLPERSFVIMTSGELSPRKNAELILRAMSDSENDAFSLIISGEGDERRRLTTLTAGFGLARRVSLPGWLENFDELIGGCDLFVMPSPHQGISNSMLQALGAGVPVIAADTDEMRELLEHPELLFDPKHVGDLATKLNLIQGQKAEYKKVHDLSLKRSRLLSFDLGKEVSRLLDQAS